MLLSALESPLKISAIFVTSRFLTDQNISNYFFHWESAVNHPYLLAGQEGVHHHTTSLSTSLSCTPTSYMFIHSEDYTIIVLQLYLHNKIYNLTHA